MSCLSADSSTNFCFKEVPGPYAVGLRVVEQYDRSRIFRRCTHTSGKPHEEESARPLQTLIWYPARAADAMAMTVRDYLELWATETGFERPQPSELAEKWWAAMAPTLATLLWARREVPAIAERFPLVIYAPGFSSVSWENADLCEYWASHGYVVIASPSLGETTRVMTADLAGVNAQARDISFLIGYAHTLSNVDTSAIAVAGFSWGGLANLFAAARDDRIAALIALDGSLRYWPALVRQAGDVVPQAMEIPLLYFAQGEITFEEQARRFGAAQLDGPNVLNAWVGGDLITAYMHALTHGEFSSMSQRSEEFWKEFPQRQKADYGRASGMEAYAWIARYTRRFLDAYLKGDLAALDYLKRTPAENGAPAHFMTVSYRAVSRKRASDVGSSPT